MDQIMFRNTDLFALWMSTTYSPSTLEQIKGFGFTGENMADVTEFKISIYNPVM